MESGLPDGNARAQIVNVAPSAGSKKCARSTSTRELQPLARHGMRARVESRDERAPELGLRLTDRFGADAVDAEVDEGLGAELLGDLHGDGDLGAAARDAGVREVLRPQPDEHVSLRAPEPGRDRLGQRQGEAAEDDRPAVAAGSEKVHRRAADERCDERVGRPVVEHLRRIHLLDDPPVEDGDPLAERHRLDLVVGDVQRRHAEALVQLGELRPHLHPQLGVEVRQGLVHQERLRMAHDRPSHRNALALPAGERPWLAVEEVLEPEQRGRFRDPPFPLGPGQALGLEREADVGAHRHVGIERVVLEHHRDVAIDRVEVVDDDVAHEDLARGRLLEAGDHPQSGRLAAARRADEDHELAVLDAEVKIVDGDRPVREPLRDAAKLDRGH